MTINCGTLDKVEHLVGNENDIYTARLVYNGKKFNITYDCKENNLIIHEWYLLNKVEIKDITNELTNYFMQLKNAA